MKKKKIVSLAILLALTLSTVQPLAAVSFKEWAQNYMKKFSPAQIKEKAIAATSKLKGYKLKDAWKKIDFMGRAQRELNAARIALEACQQQQCSAQLANANKTQKDVNYCYREGGYGCYIVSEQNQLARNAIRKCTKLHCTSQNRVYQEALTNLNKSVFALIGIIGATVFGALGAVSAPLIYFEEKEERARQERKKAKQEAALARQAQQPMHLGDVPESMPPSYEEAVGIEEDIISQAPADPAWSAPSPVYQDPDVAEIEKLQKELEDL